MPLDATHFSTLARQGRTQQLRADLARFLRSCHAGAQGTGEADLSWVIPHLRKWITEMPVATLDDMFMIATLRQPLLDLFGSLELPPSTLTTWLSGSRKWSRLPDWVRRKVAVLTPAYACSLGNLAELIAKDPREAACAVLACSLDDRVSAASSRALDEIFSLAVDRIHGAELPFSALPLLTQAAFASAYSNSPRRLDFRRKVYELAGPPLRRFQPELVTHRRAQVERSRLTVFAEVFFSGHAMHRSYRHVAAELIEHFDVTLVTGLQSKAPDLEALFPRVVYFDDSQQSSLEDSLRGAVRLIEASAADVLYLPSVGLSIFGFAVSAMRFCPVQLAGMGHPFSIPSEHLDYLAVPDALDIREGSVIPKVIRFKGEAVDLSVYDRLRDAPAMRAGNKAKNSDSTTIAVYASRMKINHRFLDVVEKIVERIPNASLRFMPNLLGTEWSAFARAIRGRFPRAEVLSAVPFQVYLDDLASCRIALQSFPFGGTNTTIDSLMLGIPTICLASDELQSAVDRAILTRLELAEAWLALDECDYVDKSVRAWSDPLKPEQRLDLQGRLRQLFDRPTGDSSLARSIAAVQAFV